MDVVSEAAQLFDRCESARFRGKQVGFVPTMGGLHDGHAALMRAARSRPAPFSVVSLFVNPSQFVEGEDFARYPRDTDADLAFCARERVDLVYAPSTSSMYPSGFQTTVKAGPLAEPLEGQCRPGHFDGVCTVVTKLLSAVGACDAVFGMKDYQQLRVIQQLVLDLNLPVNIVAHPIVRDTDGLALSTRNKYLSSEQRKRALCLSRALQSVQALFASGESDTKKLCALLQESTAPYMDSMDYAEVVDPLSLAPINSINQGPMLAVLAGHIGSARLIDNALLV